MQNPITKPWQNGWWLIIAFICLVILWQVGNLQRDSLIDEVEANGQQELNLYISYLDGQLNRYALLPALLSTEQRLADLLRHPQQSSVIERANVYLEDVARITGASDVYLMDINGTTLGASNWRGPVSFIGLNFAFRPYFTQALHGGSGRYYALGTTSGKRGYYLSHAVVHKGQTLGVVVVKISIDTFEDEWRSDSSHIVVSDPDGVVFITTRPEWRYQTLKPLSESTLKRIRDSRRYPNAKLQPINISQLQEKKEETTLFRTSEKPHQQYLMIQEARPAADWTVHLFVDLDIIKNQVLLSQMLTGAILLLLILSLWTYRQWQLRQQERRQTMQDALQLLEERVEQRTQDLTTANKRLSEEIDRHEHTREELIQAAKLAALGQMSAGINHELNQPLAAMRTYADNARTYLQRENYQQADSNLQQITELTERMAQISAQLRIFSRKSTGQTVRVSIKACIEGALKVVHPRLKQTQVDFSLDMPEQDIFVMADIVQLEQVFVNLISNACDAVEAGTGKIAVNGWIDKDTANIAIRDNGSGIDQAHIDKIFDPFFTTNEGGLGLGLSISHTIIDRLNGELRACNHAEGGAVLRISLQSVS